MFTHDFLRHSAERTPDAVAIIDAAGSVTYAALEQQANRVAHALIAAGVQRGDRVVLGVENSRHFVVSYFGALKTRAVVVPVREIEWIEAADNYARIWTGGKSFLLRESIGALERRIGKQGFARAHRRALVRLTGVCALKTSRDGELTAELESGDRIPVSRRRRAAFARALRAAESG